MFKELGLPISFEIISNPTYDPLVRKLNMKLIQLKKLGNDIRYYKKINLIAIEPDTDTILKMECEFDRRVSGIMRLLEKLGWIIGNNKK